VPGKFQTGLPPGTPARPYDHAALAALQREELATWRADTACEHKYVTPVETVVRAQRATRRRAPRHWSSRTVRA
jgi:hypothetical protein